MITWRTLGIRKWWRGHVFMKSAFVVCGSGMCVWEDTIKMDGSNTHSKHTHPSPPLWSWPLQTHTHTHTHKCINANLIIKGQHFASQDSHYCMDQWESEKQMLSSLDQCNKERNWQRLSFCITLMTIWMPSISFSHRGGALWDNFICSASTTSGTVHLRFSLLYC